MFVIPDDASDGVKQAFRDVHSLLAGLTSGNLDLKGRRIINAGPSISTFDYVVKSELEAAAFRSSAGGSLVTSTSTSTSISLPVDGAGFSLLNKLRVGSGVKGANAPIDAKILALQTNVVTAVTSQFNLSALFYAEQTVANANSIQGAVGYTVASNPSGTTTLAIGVAGNVEHAGAGTVTNLRGVQGGVQISSTGGGTDAACFYAAPSGHIAGGSGTVTNGYGLYVGSFGAGFTNKYAIYCADFFASNVLAGYTQLGVVYALPANAPPQSHTFGLAVYGGTADSSQFNINTAFYTTQTAATANSIQGVNVYTAATHTSGTVTLLESLIGNAEHAGTSTLTNMRGVQGNIVIGSTGGGTAAACLYANPAGQVGGGSGTFTNGYGLLVGNFGAGFTNVHALLCTDANADIVLTSDGAIKSTTNTWQVSSDRRLKQNIRPFMEGLSLLRQIQPVIYELNGLTHEAHAGRPGVSVIAQDVEPLLSPELRALMIGHQSIDGEDYYTFNNGPLAYVMHNAILELAAAQEALTRRLTALEGQGA